MKRKVYLKGELGELFGEEFNVFGRNFQECFQCVAANRPTLKNYIADAANAGTNYVILVDGKELSEEDLTEPSSGDIELIPIPAGSKSSWGKIVVGLAVLGTLMFAPGALPGVLTTTSTTGTTVLSTAGTLVSGMATSLALAGIQELLAPDPSVDMDQPDNYLFNGSQQNVVEGDPIPLLYGELRVPGTPISFEIINREFPRNNVIVDSEGNLMLAGV